MAPGWVPRLMPRVNWRKRVTREQLIWVGGGGMLVLLAAALGPYLREWQREHLPYVDPAERARVEQVFARRAQRREQIMTQARHRVEVDQEDPASVDHWVNQQIRLLNAQTRQELGRDLPADLP